MRWLCNLLYDKVEMMNKIVLVSIVMPFLLHANDKIFECTKVFEERKGELILELERIDEQRQSLSALKAASDDLLNRKEKIISDKEAKIAQDLASIEEKEQNIKAMLEKNRKVLEDINNQKMDNISKTFSKMKPGAAAGVLSDMKVEEAARILRVQKPKTIGKILTKMDAKKASALTLELSKEVK